tara:strand:- start:3992 stop:5020 length:1029 start_codon:yes stop_codon:yes gene_type:complete
MRVNGVISEALKKSGNQTVWTDLITHFKKKQTPPILLWGPTGCGKTCGVKECADICGLKIYEIEPSVLDSTEDLKKWLYNITGSKTLLGPRMILVDIVEGIDPSYISIFEAFIKKNTVLQTPIVFIMDNAYNLSLRNFINLIPIKMRCYRPNAIYCTSLAKASFGKHIPLSIIQQSAQHCGGNIRNLKCRILNSGNYVFFHESDDSLSLFESTNKFLTNKLCPEKWILCADKNSLNHLIYDNYPLFLSSDIHNVARMSEELSQNSRNQYYEELHYDILNNGNLLKLLCNFTYAPKMILEPKPIMKLLKPVRSKDDYLNSFSRLHIPPLLLDPEIFYIDKNPT